MKILMTIFDSAHGAAMQRVTSLRGAMIHTAAVIRFQAIFTLRQYRAPVIITLMRDDTAELATILSIELARAPMLTISISLRAH